MRLEVRRPGASTDALKQLQTGRADLAILDIHDLGLARERGRDVVGRVRDRAAPAGGRDRAARRSRARAISRAAAPGVTGLPSDEAVLRSVVAGDGGDPGRVRATTIGFEAVKALLAGRVDAATAFWNAEGVALKRRRPGFTEFRVDDFGAPRLSRAGAVRHPHDARGAPTARARGDPGAAARLRAGAGGARQRGRPRCSSRRAGATGPSSPRSSTPSPRPSPPAPAPRASCARTSCASGRAWDRRFGILSKPLDVSAGVRLRPGGPGPQPLISRSAARPARRPRGPSASAARRGRSPPHRRGAWCRRPRASRRRACACSPSSPSARRRSTSATPSKPVEARSTISASAPSGCASAPLERRLVAGRAQHPEHVGAQQQVVEDGDDARHRRYCARMRRNSCRTDSGRPHIWVVSTRPVRHSRRTSSPAMPASSSSFSVPCTAGAAAAWPNWWATRSFQCQSWCEYGSALQVTTSVAAST